MSALDPAKPVPGVYEDVPFETYCAVDALNKSLLDWMYDFSPMHLNWARTHPEGDTNALLVGRAFHTLVLRGKEEYEKEFRVSDQCQATTGKGSRCTNPGTTCVGGTWFCGVHLKGQSPDEGVAILSQDDAMTVARMSDRVFSHASARGFVKSPGKNELTLIWRDVETEVLCKAMVDMLRPTWSAIGDLKTTTCAAAEKFSKSVNEYGYHRQAAFYLSGAITLGLGVEHFAFIAIEKPAPSGVATYQMDSVAVEVGRDQNRKLLRKYAECAKSGIWPGYEDEFPLLTLPDYQIRKEMKKLSA